CYHHSSGMWTF
nr:immunoglobulin light chain junction region [Macaca mulatta]MOV37010.1 immunoglobulin light chain junction region [Macaca mulatta]MOV37221.1 immunoglobulin light chain junction region [Macaca mulatta]MOV37231.1 immunoglobulin light chain junction region [Macaca mulatta]MOV37412.1 immunoglobulin light chain junction region [Macaca mulatta]